MKFPLQNSWFVGGSMKNVNGSHLIYGKQLKTKYQIKSFFFEYYFFMVWRREKYTEFEQELQHLPRSVVSRFIDNHTFSHGGRTKEEIKFATHISSSIYDSLSLLISLSIQSSPLVPHAKPLSLLSAFREMMNYLLWLAYFINGCLLFIRIL